MKKEKVLLFGIVLLKAGILFSAPSIQTVVSTFTQGATLTISGTNFGTRFDSDTCIFDKFESGTFSSSWTETNDLIIASTQNRNSYSNYSAHLNFTPTAYDGMLRLNHDQPSNYVEYWYMIEQNWAWGTTIFIGTNTFLANIKILRFWDSGNDLANIFLQMGYPGLGAASYIEDENLTNTTAYIAWTMGGTDRQLWHHLQAEFRDSSINGMDGILNLWIDGALKYSSTTLNTRNDTNLNYKRVQVIGFDNAWGLSAGEVAHYPNDFFMDNVFLASSWARVELGDSPIYNNCTHREILAVSNWTTTSVSAKMDYQSFSTTDLIYILLTDSDGNHSVGFDIHRKPAVAAAYSIQ